MGYGCEFWRGAQFVQKEESDNYIFGTLSFTLSVSDCDYDSLSGYTLPTLALLTHWHCTVTNGDVDYCFAIIPFHTFVWL